MQIFGDKLSEGRHSLRRGPAQIEYTVEEIPGGYLIRGDITGGAGTLEVFRSDAPPEFLVNNWQSWGPMLKLTPGARIPGMEKAMKSTSRALFSAVPALCRENLLSDYFLAWNGGLAGFLTSKTAHPFVIIHPREIIGYLEYFGRECRESVPLEPLLILRGGAVEELLERYADMVCEEHALSVSEWNPVGWCSWYQYFTRLSWQDILKNVALARDKYPFEVFQIDDGYEMDIGDWLERRAGWPAIPEMAGTIRESSFTPVIWTAPFSVARTSRLFSRHPDWLVSDRGAPRPCYRGWEKEIYALDAGHPAAREWLSEVFTALKEAGFRYFKIDFLFAAAMEGARTGGITPVEAYRLGLEAIRKAVGRDFILGCGAPLLSSVGLVDGMRIGEDTAPFWDSTKCPLEGPNACHALRNALMRGFMHRRLWLNDPDCLLLRDTDLKLSENERETYALTSGILDNMILESDDLALVKPAGAELLKRSLALRGGRPSVRGLLGEDCFQVESSGRVLRVNLSDVPSQIGGIRVNPRSADLQE